MVRVQGGVLVLGGVRGGASYGGQAGECWRWGWGRIRGADELFFRAIPRGGWGVLVLAGCKGGGSLVLAGSGKGGSAGLGGCWFCMVG